MPDSDQKQPGGEADLPDSFDDIAATFGILPEVVGPGDSDGLNLALQEMFETLRQAALLRLEGKDRAAAISALRAAWTFVARFKMGLAENLHLPLLRLGSALVALDQSKVEPLLIPTMSPAGGRAPDSPERQALMGIAAGTVGRLQWAGLRRAAAHKVVADALHNLGLKPSRGSSRMTDRTVRNWCETVDADVGGYSIAAINAKAMLTAEWQAKIKALSPKDARIFVLAALAANLREMMPGAGRQKKPVNPLS